MSSSSVASSACRRVLLRRFCNKTFFVALRVLIFINKLLLLAPIAYHRGAAVSAAVSEVAAFRPQRVIVLGAALACLCFALSAPFLVRVNASMYGVTNVQHDELFVRIAVATLISDVAASLLIWAAQIWQRRQIAKCLNAYCKMLAFLCSLTDDLLGWQLLALFVLKLCHTLYELLQNVPFLCQHAADISPLQLSVFVATLYLQALKAIFALDMFAAILLLNACFRQLEMSLKRTSGLRRGALLHNLLTLENNLHSLAKLCIDTFQFPILLLLVCDFVNFLANLYAVLYHFIYSQQQYLSLTFYCVSLAINLYSLILCAHLCTAQHQRVKDSFLHIDAHFPSHPQSWPSLFVDPYWMQPVEFPILGMISLSNSFWLDLVSYSSNFIVIILQFAIKEKRQ